MRAPSLLSLLALTLACGAPPLTPTASDRAPEQSLSRARLLAEFSLEGEHLVSERLQAPELATRVAVMLDVESSADIVGLEARAIGLDDEPGPWRPLTVTWSEHPTSVMRVDFARTARAAQLRVRASDVDDVKWLLWSAFVPADERAEVALDAPGAAPLDGAVGVASPAMARQGLLAGVNSRSSWNARAATCSTSESYKSRITVHHTVTYPDSGGSYEARIRAIQAFHMDGRGYCDIAYHVMVTLDGQLWEARPETVRGGHTGGQNTGNLGVSLIGCFHPTSDCSGIGPNQPSADMVAATAQAIGTAALTFGISISSATVMGHRDNPGQSTACPGDNVHGQLDAIRAAATGGGVLPEPEPTTGRARGTVWDLSITDQVSESSALGARIVGATVTIDGESETLSADDTLWTFDLAPGTYTVSASADGFTTATREVTVTAGNDQWASIGLSPAPTSTSVTVHVYDADDGPGHTLENASVQLTGVDAQLTDDNGKVEVVLPAGNVTLTVTAEGYEPVARELTLVAGVPRTEQVGLLPVVVAPPEEEPPSEAPPEDPEAEPPPKDEDPPVVVDDPADEDGGDLVEHGDVERVSVSAEYASDQAAQGCSATSTNNDGVPWAVFALLSLPVAFARRRRQAA
jgi:MYXO-CTERM domain-containing protein